MALGSINQRISLTILPIDGGVAVRYCLMGAEFRRGTPLICGEAGLLERATALCVQDDAGIVPCTTVSSELPGREITLARSTRGRLYVSYSIVTTGDRLVLEVGAYSPKFKHGRASSLLILPHLDGTFALSLAGISSKSLILSCPAESGARIYGSVEQLYDTYFFLSDDSCEYTMRGVRIVYRGTESLGMIGRIADYFASAHGYVYSAFDSPVPRLTLMLSVEPDALPRGIAVHGATVIVCDERFLGSIALCRVIDHEVMHGLCYLNEEGTEWFTEGVAEALALVLPFVDGRLPVSQVVRRINTASHWASRVPNLGCHPGYPGDAMKEVNSAVFREPYHLGLIYLFNIWSGLEEVHYTLIDLLCEVREIQLLGGLVDSRQWRELLTACGIKDELIAPRVEDSAMAFATLPSDFRGRIQHDSVTTFAKVEPGFSWDTFDTGLASGVADGCPAHVAGVRNGDILIGLPSLEEIIARNLDVMEFSVESARSGRRLRIPTGFESVTSRCWSEPGS